MIDRIKDFLRSPSFRQLVRYGISGATAVGLEMLTFWLLKDKLPLLWTANTLAMIVGFWTSFLLNKFWSFEAKGSFYGQFVRYLILFAFNLGASNLMIYLMHDVWSLDKIVAKLISIAVITSWNFFLFKKIVYR